MNISELLKEAKVISSYEKIESGIHNFTFKNIEFRETEKSKKLAIIYSGFVLNSKGTEQNVNVVDLCDTDTATKYSIANLLRLLNYFNINTDNINNIDDLVKLANDNLISKSVKLEFIKKIINGGLIIKEKIFVLK